MNSSAVVDEFLNRCAKMALDASEEVACLGNAERRSREVDIGVDGRIRNPESKVAQSHGLSH